MLAEQRNNTEPRPHTARDVTPDLLWASVANKRAYTDLHGYALYVVPAPLQTLRPAASWDKLAAVQAVFEAHPEHEWVWALDLDTFVLNLDSGVEHIIALADHQRRAHGRGVELIVARDCNGINAGSMLVRRSAWTSYLLERMWSDEWRSVPDVDIWWEQAVLMHLHATDADVQERTLFVPQRTLNAYPAGTRCGKGYVVSCFCCLLCVCTLVFFCVVAAAAAASVQRAIKQHRTHTNTQNIQTQTHKKRTATCSSTCPTT